MPVAGWVVLLMPALSVAAEVPPADPAALHRFLRENPSSRLEVERALSRWTLRTGDRSFSCFERPSPQLKGILRLQAKAAQSWEQGDLSVALDLYQTAVRKLVAASCESEAAFCLYYISEILFEMDRPRESLEVAGRALELAMSGGVRRHYLEALLWQSRGYSLWFMDHLRASVRAFGEAQMRWRHLQHAEGESTIWNNLAVLYEELRIPRKAESCYRRALSGLPAGANPSIQLQLRLNLSLLLATAGRRPEAVAYLSESEAFRQADPFEFLRVASQVQPESFRSKLEAASPQAGTQQVERMLALAKTETRPAEKLALLKAAAALSRKLPRKRLHRRVLTELASRLEKEDRYQEALGIYLRAFRERQMEETSPEFVYPFSRAESPLVYGAVRCLVELGRSDDAWEQIQSGSRRRRESAAELISSRIDVASLNDELQGLLDSARLAKTPRTGAIDVPACAAVSQEFRPPAYTILELWPSGRELLAWIFNPSGRKFRRIALDGSVSSLSEELLSAFYQSGSALPPAPPSPLLRRAYLQLFAPLEDLLETRRLLVVGHESLQGLPFELLLDGRGRFLLERYAFSYLPSLCLPKAVYLDRRVPPVMLQPSAFSLPGEEKERKELDRLFPDLQIVSSLDDSTPLQGSLIHVSSHFRLHPAHWLSSQLAAPRADIRLSRFLNQPVTCRLLSLGICDAGNTFSWQPPYALGLAELLLMRPVGGIILSRWRLDELSLEIYFDVLRRARQGEALDLALANARRSFIQGQFQRAGIAARSHHPFFWAGIAYIGVPGYTLQDEFPGAEKILPAVALLIGLALLVGWRLKSVARASLPVIPRNLESTPSTPNDGQDGRPTVSQFPSFNTRR